MNATYNDVLDRIKEERRRLSLSQKEMSRFVHMNQSNYSKVEVGGRRLNYFELKYLCESPADVQYIFTGQKSDEKYKEFFMQFDYSQLINIYNIVSSMSAARTGNASDNWKNIFIKTENLCSKKEKRGAGIGIFLLARHLQNYRQLEMARMLGVDVKKYRELENGRNLPDSELVWQLYDLFYISPAITLKDRKSLVSSICFEMENFNEEMQKKVLGIIKIIMM